MPDTPRPHRRPPLLIGAAHGRRTALLDGLGGTTKTFFKDFARRTVGHTMADSMAGVGLTLVAADSQDRSIDALCRR
ncbi:hypothetical protein ACFY0A_43835 [Streptomyces sp. NPDC001698]|uniref:hypothetical protein n=1 Tax=unclassified Streptomyces TaxID=2593676 RepID=UPI0036AF275F